MSRIFLKYSIVALAAQIVLLVPYYYWLFLVHDGRAQGLVDVVCFLYVPVWYMVGPILKLFVGGGENAVLWMLLVAPGIGALLYSLGFGILVCGTRRAAAGWRRYDA